MSKSKSVLDGVPVTNAAFKTFGDYIGDARVQVGAAMEPVGHCPQCGNPIYGPKQAVAGQPIQTQRTCCCAQYPLNTRTT